ncbi:MAG: endonuclease/exonuclease/phosphatase family protein [Thermoleophilaceae bacterium]
MITSLGARLLTWNVNGRTEAAAERQIERVLDRGPAVIALQELRRASYALWVERLTAADYSLASTIDLVALPYPGGAIRRRYFNLTAARVPIAPLPGLEFADPEQARIAFPEKFIATAVALDGTLLEIHNAHLPPGSTRGIAKVHAFQAIHRRVGVARTRPRILCGDFNTPRREDDDSIETWASARPNIPEWDEAERLILVNPDMRDLYRERRRRGDPYPVSHYTRGMPRRYDHVFGSHEVAAERVCYLTAWLDEGLSDHAAVELDFRVSC